MKIILALSNGADHLTYCYPASAAGMRQAQMDRQTWAMTGYTGRIYDPRQIREVHT